MRGLSIRQELEDVLNSKLLEVFTEPFPHVLEITQKHNQVPPKDNRPNENRSRMEMTT